MPSERSTRNRLPAKLRSARGGRHNELLVRLGRERWPPSHVYLPLNLLSGDGHELPPPSPKPQLQQLDTILSRWIDETGL